MSWGWTRSAGRRNSGSNGPSVADFDNDGTLDLFVARYGANYLFHTTAAEKFTDVARARGVAGGEKGDSRPTGAINARRDRGFIRVVVYRKPLKRKKIFVS